MDIGIHPTALVEPGAQLGPECQVGPYACVGAGVRLGARCVVQAHAVLMGSVVAGDDNFFGVGAVIGAAPQDFAYSPSVQSSVLIGNGNIFREYVTIHLGTKEGSATVIGNKTFLMAGSHCGHNSVVGDGAIIANNCLLAGYVEIGERAVLGGGTVFHQFMKVGRLAMVRGGTRFGKDIPPFTVADGENLLSGINAIGLRRNGFSPEARSELREAFKLVFRSGFNVSQALAEAGERSWRSAETREFLEFIGASKRGVCAANQRKTTEGADDFG